MSNDNVSSNEVSILNELDTLDLSSIETGVPILPARIYSLQVDKVEVVENKKKTGHNLTIELSTVNTEEAEGGKVLNPGFKVFDLISLVKTDKYNPIEKLAAFKESATGSKSGNFNPPEQYIGAIVQVRLAIEDDKEYGRKNRINRYLKKS